MGEIRPKTCEGRELTKDPSTMWSLQMGLPKNKHGVPKPAPPWIAAALYWVATQPALQPRTGLTVTPAADAHTPALFRISRLQGEVRRF